MNTRPKRVLSALAAACMVSAMPVLTAAPVQAGAGIEDAQDTYTWRTTDDNPGGEAEFTQYGDKLEVCDTDADGWSAIVYVEESDGFPLYRVEAKGRFNCESISASEGFNLEEGAKYRFELCLAHVSNDDDFCNREDLTA